MYQLRQAVLGTAAILLLTSAGSWRLTDTARGQEWNEPQLFQAQQRGSVSGPISRSTQAEATGAVRAASYESTDEESPKNHAPAAQSGDGRSPTNRFGEVAQGAPATQPQSNSAPSRLDAAPPLGATRVPLPAGPAPLPISRDSTIASSHTNSDRVDGEAPQSAAASGIDTLLTVAGSLGIVLGLFMVTMWCLRKSVPKAVRPVPGDVVEVLGRAPLVGRQQMHLIRFGSKLVLAAVTPTGIESLSEITDPVEVDRLIGYCEQTRSTSASASFRGILDRLDERSVRDADEPPRRSNRELSSLAGMRRARAEDDYA